MEAALQIDRVNKKVLTGSAIFTILLTIYGLTFGLLSGSQVILFDGLFNLVGIGVTYSSIFATKFIRKPDEHNYPFGKDSLEPFLAIAQYCLILYLCISNVLGAVQTIISGGNMMSLSLGATYGFFAAVFNIAVIQYLKYHTRKFSTVIANVEIAAWRFSCWLSCGIMLGFVFSLAMEHFSLLTNTSQYVDSFLTIVITLVFAKTALFEMYACFKELMQAKPQSEIIEYVKGKMESVIRNYDIQDKILRVTKVGGQVIVEIDFVIENGSDLDSIMSQDSLRKQIIDSIDSIDFPYKKWVNINFTGDLTLANHNV